jgi:hypothetical protein
MTMTQPLDVCVTMEKLRDIHHDTQKKQKGRKNPKEK